MYWYDEIVQAAILADLCGFVLILCVYLKNVNRYFELFKTVALSACIFNKNYGCFRAEKLFNDKCTSAYSLHYVLH